jgi:histone H3/H4
MIAVRTQVKEILKEAGLGVEQISGDFMSKLDERVTRLIIEAAERAKDNGRRTVMGKDI